MKNTIIQELVFGSTVEKAKEKLQELLKETLSNNETIVFKNKGEFKTDKRHVKIIENNETAQGYRCDVAHVDYQLPVWKFNKLVLPATLHKGSEKVIRYF